MNVLLIICPAFLNPNLAETMMDIFFPGSKNAKSYFVLCQRTIPDVF